MEGKNLIRRTCLTLTCLAFGGLAVGQTITTSGLLKQMTDLDWLTHRPKPYFKMTQASSYDRAATTPADPKTWFANGDAGNYLRIENRDGRKEYVMADLKGPGAVVRLWSANPAGVLRFYFDGETTPRFQAVTADLLNGKMPPFTYPFSYDKSTAANGTNLYFPFPYAKSLKITADDSGGDGAKHMYYEVGYRTYESGTQVETFEPGSLPSLTATMRATGARLADSPLVTASERDSAVVKRGVTGQPLKKTLTASNGGVVRKFEVKIPFPLVQNIRAMDWDDAYQPHNVLRNSILTITCDGEVCIKAPLGDFFATVPGPTPYHSYPMTVTKDGTLTSYFPMPFKKRMDISIQPPKGISVPMTVNLAWDKRAFDENTYYFRAHWNIDISSTRPFKDMEFLNTTGEGLWVGTHLHVTNPSPKWWGEGDEKVYVDGESFPSTFGTGSEDYFGYAWSSYLLFDRPYHGQAHCDGPGTFGHISVHRWQTFDPISFEKSLRFDMEMWHWDTVDARFARMSYWYAKPGAKTVEKPYGSRELELLEMKPPQPVKGAIEVEGLKHEITGGKTSQQEGFFELSAGKQLWWVEANEGDTLKIHVPVKAAGRYEIVGHLCHARDYGIHSIRFTTTSGKELSAPKTFDFFGDGVSWKKLTLATADLPAGEVILEVTCKGHRKEAIPSNMFGLDYLMLNRK